MKKIMILISFFVLLLPIISAVQIDIKDELKQSETLIAKLSGNFLQPILKDNIYFYRDYQQVPFPFELLKIEQDYFIHTSTSGKISGNYSLVIKESEYYVAGGQISTDDITENFSILEGYADFSVTPGVLITQGVFSLELQNLKDEQITIYIDKDISQEQEGFFSFLSGDKTPTGQAFTLNPGEFKQVTLEFENITNTTLRTLKLSTQNFSTEIFIYVLYTGQEIVLNETNQTEINQTEVNETNETSIGEGINETPSIGTCEEENGTICKVDEEKCKGEIIEAQDNVCCLGECVEKKKSNAGKIIGWGAVIVLVALYIWFYLKKYKRTRKKLDLLKVAEGKK